MAKLTTLIGNEFYLKDGKISKDNNGYFGEAVTKLGKFESFYSDLISSQTKISEELVKLRTEEKTKTVKFKELVTKKMVNNMIISQFKMNGIEE